MIRILLADDEGIMLNSMRSIIETNFGSECEVFTAKTGRAAIEIAESEKPDIAFMDIHMPGINGIEAMKQIREGNENILFVVITAFSKFDYARDAINIGVFEYLSKPVNKQMILDVLKRAIREVEKNRKRKIDNLRIREKLETVVPIIESGFINSLLFQDANSDECDYYRELLNIEEKYGYVILLTIGEEYEQGVLTNPVGSGMRAQKFYSQMRQIISDYFHCLIGQLMSNKAVIMVLRESGEDDYEERIAIIERTRNMIKSLESQIDAKFVAGIGHNGDLQNIKDSYKEALRCLEESKVKVAHVDDLPLVGKFVEEYPVEIEKKIFGAVAIGDEMVAKEYAEQFFSWMTEQYSDYDEEIKLKVLELVMRAETEAFNRGGMDYGFRYRKDYLSEVLGIQDYEQLKKWFLIKLAKVCKNMAAKNEEKTESIITKAMSYIDVNFSKDISLDDVSKHVNVSPYYFSKLFKEESGVNFIDYLTRKRIDYSKELLKNPELSIKEICIMSGYSEPNYFSRIFKKKEGITPTEYKEKIEYGNV